MTPKNADLARMPKPLDVFRHADLRRRLRAGLLVVIPFSILRQSLHDASPPANCRRAGVERMTASYFLHPAGLASRSVVLLKLALGVIPHKETLSVGEHRFTEARIAHGVTEGIAVHCVRKRIGARRVQERLVS